MRVTYRQMPPTAVFYARGMGPYASSCGEAWQRIGEWLAQNCARKRVRIGHETSASVAGSVTSSHVPESEG